MKNTAYKTVTTDRANNTTVSIDPELQVALKAGNTYAIRGQFAFRASTGGDFNHGFHFDGTLTYGFGMSEILLLMYQDTAQPDASHASDVGAAWDSADISSNSPKFFAGVTGAYWNHVKFSFVLKVSTDGTFGLTWAQYASDAAPASVLAGAVMSYEVMP